MLIGQKNLGVGNISRRELLERVSIAEPYFALENVMVHANGVVAARVPIEHGPGLEIPPISSAEAGRHAAILGACSCAMSNGSEGRHYYLACQADARREVLGACDAKCLIGRAKCIQRNKRTAVARAELRFEDGSLYSTMEVTYQVMPAVVFERLFRHGLVGEAVGTGRVCAAESIEADQCCIDGSRIASYFGSIVPSMCAGHFPKMPALPVSTEVGLVVGQAVRLLRSLKTDPATQFCVTRCAMSAEKLILPLKPFTIGVERARLSDGIHVMRGQVVCEDEVCSEMEMHIAVATVKAS